MTLLDCINRILRSEAIIRGDTDTVTALTQTQHSASLNLAVVAIQNEIVDLIATKMIPKERKTTGSIGLTTQTRTYSLATDFTAFWGEPHFYNASQNRQIYEYAGGLERLQIDIYNYATQYGQPNWWYWEPGQTTYKQVGFFQVPSSAENGQAWTYDYQASVLVSNGGDSLPFHNDEENYMFTQMAARRFKFMWADTDNKADVQAILNNDVSYRTAMARLYALLKGTKPKSQYGNAYV